MPLSEMHKLTTRGNLEKAQTKTSTYSSDLSSFMPDSEFVELLWENGQIVMHGQSNRPRKSIGNAVSSLSVKGQDKDECPKLGRFGAVDSLPNELSHIVPSGIGLNTQDDYAAPWMNYSVEDPLQNDYCSEFLSEFSGVDLNAIANDNICTPADRSNGFGLGRDSQKAEHGHASRGPAGGSDPSRIRTSNLFRLPQQCQSSVPNPKSRTVELDAYGSSSNHQGSSVGILTERTQKQNLANSKQTGSGTSFLNFSHFSRPVALAKANLQSAQRLKSNEKESAAASSSRSESTLVNYSGAALKSVGAIQGNSAPVPCDVVLGSATKASQDRAFIQPSEVIDAYKNQYNSTICNDIGRPTDHSNHQSRGFVSSTALARPEIDKAPEAAVASSVCSGFTPGATSNDPKHGAKRKIREGEENEYQSEDIEDESVGKKPAPGRSTSAKRSRAAEVHNLSERRRRDRINERMRALQELIPNCSKVDKASMLDEAIEYLKTLQLQVQIMSMGSGLCMPPIMLPPGMQHIRAPLMGHYSPMGVGMGMGMGMGYGMGMLDMNGSPGCPLIPVPPMHGPQYACSSIAGAPGLHGMPPTSSLQMFGIPGQGLPVSIPRPQQYNSFSALPLKQNTMPEIPGAATCPVTAPSAETAPSSRSKDLLRQNMNLERPLKASTANSSIQTTSIQVGKECPQQPTAARISDHTLLGTINATPEDENAAS